MITFIKYGILLIVSAWLVLKGIVPAWNTIHSDFSNYYVSSKLISEKQNLENLYNNEWFQNQIKIHGINEPGKFAPFPPLTAWVMLPISFTDVLTAKRIWTIFNCVVIIFCVWLISRITLWSWSTSALLLLATGNGLINNFKFGQVYLIVTGLILLAIYLHDKFQGILSGALLGFVTCLKYFPIVFIASFFALKNYRVVIYSVLSIFVLTILQIWFFGSTLIFTFINNSLLPHLDGDLEGQGMYSFLFQSWDGLFRHLFVYSAKDNPTPFLDWPDGRSIFKLITHFAVGISLILVSRKIILSSLSEDVKKKLLLSLPAVAAFVVLPASASYHFILLVLPLTLLLSSELLIKNEKIILICIYSAIGFLPIGFFFRVAEKTGVIFAYPRLGLITLFYVITLYIINSKISLRKL